MVSIGDLEGWRSTLEILIVFAAAAIFIGVYLERDAEPEPPKDVKARATGLVANGMMLELACVAFLWPINIEIARLQGVQFTELAKKSADAKQVADEAIKQASIAKENLARIAKAESELEKRQSNLLDVLTPPQLEYMKFSSDLAGVAPTPIVIEAEPDPTSQFFAADLDAAFRQAHWPQRSIVPAAMGFIPGIWVKYLYSPADDTARKIAQVVCSALNAQLLAKATVFPAITLEAEHERFRRMGLPENIWLSQHGNGPGALEWPETAPAKAVVIHVGQNRNNFFFNNARIKKGLPPLPDVSSAAPPCGG